LSECFCTEENVVKTAKRVLKWNCSIRSRIT